MWEIIHEMDNEDGSPTCFGCTIDDAYYWVTKFKDGWHVETKPVDEPYADIVTLKVYKTASYAMRWVDNNIAA